jgi:hypothetical protein
MHEKVCGVGPEHVGIYRLKASHTQSFGEGVVVPHVIADVMEVRQGEEERRYPHSRRPSEAVGNESSTAGTESDLFGKRSLKWDVTLGCEQTRAKAQANHD